MPARARGSEVPYEPEVRARASSACRRALRALAIVLLVLGARSSRAQSPDIEIFTRAGCPHCEHAKQFLDDLSKQRPELIIRELPVDHDPVTGER